MAKVAFSKFKAQINKDEVPVQIGDETVAVKQYLPTQDKLELIGNVIMRSHDPEYNYANPVQIKVYKELEILFAYTNISFTDKQKEDTPKLYDQLYCSGIFEKVFNAIPEEELKYFDENVESSINAIYAYQNSLLGMLDMMHEDKEVLDFDLTELQDNIKEGKGIEFVQDMLTKVN